MDVLSRAFIEALETAMAELPEDQAVALLQCDERLGKIVRGEIEYVVPTIFQALVENAPDMLRERRASLNEFERVNFEKWGRALDLFEALLVIALEAGSAINSAYRPTAFANKEIRFLVLTTLHARSCQIAGEVLALLKSGFADGAHARWRSLHEVAVIAFVLAGGEDDLVERYVLHEQVEEYKAALEYQNYCARLGYTPYSDDEIRVAQKRCEDLLARFGKPFRNQYGWAADRLGNKKPNFVHIEQMAGLDHLRPYYRLASHNIHASSKGSTFRLGKRPSHDFLLAGPSSIGLGDPTHGTAISLYQATVALLATWPNLDRLVVLRVMEQFVRAIGEEIIAVELK
jgi:hypothetical protein